jgi:kinesin family member C1
MSNRNRRLSMGGGAGGGAAPPFFRDSSSMHNSRSSSVSRRRMSIGVVSSSASFRHETPVKDRHTLLEEYRMQQQQQQKRALEPDSSEYQRLPSSMVADGSQRFGASSANLPLRSTASAATAANFFAEGSTALERFRMRKQQKLQQQYQTSNDESFHQNTTYNSSSQNGSYYEPNEAAFDEPTISYSQLTYGATAASGTPRRHAHSNNLSIHSMTGTIQRRPPSVPVIASRSLGGFSQEGIGSLSQETDAGLSQLSQESGVGTVESVARYEDLQKRLRQVEEEKMSITMAMAPMEARHRQKEDAWMKEQSRLLQEIESLKQQSQTTDERYRDVKAQKEVTDEENRQLRLQVRKESSTLYTDNAAGNSSAWSRHLQIDRDAAELREKLRSAEEEIRAGRLDRVSVEKELHATKMELDSVVRAYEELQEEYDVVSQTTSDEREAQIKLEALTTEHIATSAQLNALCSDLAANKAAFRVAMEAKDAELEKFKFEVSVMKTRAASMEDLNKSANGSDVEDYAVLKARIEERDRKIAEFEKERLSWEAMRRQMHNRIQELRGNIRVFVRTRPFLPNDGGESESAIDVSPGGESLSIFDARTAAPYSFSFDKVFPPSSGQDQVFDEVSDFVQSALDGYHVCLFSYGQTGSGKTHTMQGSGNGAMRGIIPRAVEQILIQCHALRGQKWQYSLSASFLEIYNEELKDLLVDAHGNSAECNRTKLAIKRSREGKSYVEGLSEIAIDSTDSVTGMEQLEALMKVAARSRSVASTKMNAQSSRSHSVFMLNLRGYNGESGAEVHGALNLCDLAGSERLDRSGANSDVKRLKETQAINKSLSCLGDVFNALAQKSSHVPYRNSKLTYLLQDCLSGDGKALMFVNLSPTNQSSNESLCSLRFAQRVNQVELGKATKHIQYNR